MDNAFSYDCTNNIAWYKLYQILMPAKQTALLSLRDKLAIPHNHEKQMLGVLLPIIGFDIDLSSLSVTMPDESCSELVTAIQDFVRVPPSRHRCHSLRDFQCLTGWINCALNMHPLLCLGLSVLILNVHGPCAYTRASRKVGLCRPISGV